MLKLKRLHIKQFGRLAPNTELVFNDGFNVLLGRNGAGKTSLLELIVAVLRADLAAYRDEPFDLEWEYATDEESARIWVKNQPGAVSSRRAHPPLTEASHWKFEIQYASPGKQLVYSASSDGSVDTNSDSVQGRRFDVFDVGFVPYLIAELSDFNEMRGDTLWMELVEVERAAFRLDESLGGYQVLVGTDTQGMHVKYPICVVDRTDRKSHLIDCSYFPDQFLEAIGNSLLANSEPHFTSDESPLLAEIAIALGAHTVQLGARLEETLPYHGFQRSKYRGFNIQVTFHDRRTVTAPLLSFGQKRLLSFLYHVASNNHFIIADEMVNGLHWEWIETCLRAIGDRQAFLTSQNPLLLDALPIDSQEAAARTFIHCSAHLGDHTTTWQWQNLSERDARELWEAYSVGIQGIGEILRARGMW